jgi:hypothetical protein
MLIPSPSRDLPLNGTAAGAHHFVATILLDVFILAFAAHD